MKDRIAAVIPARAGSKGVPNKNIRLIKGHPMIWYAINNARTSKYITDIIVTSDSDEIEMIARQMGVEFRRRSKLLCQDNVTLDAVVFDAVKDMDCDYVVTMQPTSPTLQPATLDRAIEYALSNNLDTLISVVNKPFLSWRDENGTKVPNYEKRVNRQYLPANYMETGAFVISKKSVVTEYTRIGSRTDVYEISDDEGVDIDDFRDFMIAESVITKPKIGIYVNGNKKIGMGHICRALELADEFYCKPDIIYDKTQTQIESFGDTTYNLTGIDGDDDMISLAKQKQYTLLINDILDTDRKWMMHLKEALPNGHVVNFEDMGEGAQIADSVVNALYSGESTKNLLLGSDYYIAPKKLLMYEPIELKEKVEKVLITFGGADPQNYTERILRIISRESYSKYKFTVVLGKLNENAGELMEYNKFSNIEVAYDVVNMPKLMWESDMAITSRGRTTYELASMGIPTIAMAQNKRETLHGFACSDNGFTYLGLNPGDHLIEMELLLYLDTSIEDRRRFQQLMLSKNLRLGRKNIMDILRKYI